MSSNKLYAFVRDEIVPMEKAVLHISDLSVQRGYGIFDFFKIREGHAFFLDNYLDRFYHSAEIMRLSVPYARPALKSIIFDLIKKNDLPESGIKMILTGGYSEDGYQPSIPNLIITHHELLLPASEQLEKGIKIITHEYVRDLPEAKTINYSMGIWLLDKIKEHNALDVLYQEDGVVSEFPRCNFFIVTADDTVVTPHRNVLHGVTRKNVLALAGKKYNSKVAAITLEDVYSAKEAFLTSTTKRIVPIVMVNETTIGTGKPGNVTFSLLEDLKTLEDLDLSRAAASKTGKL